MFLVALLVLVGAKGFSGLLPSPCSGQEVSGSRGIGVGSAPAEFRNLDLQPLQIAAGALRTLRGKPNDRQVRSTLVKVYSNTGFLGASRFFENTLRDLDNGELAFGPVETDVAWAASERDLSAQVTQVAIEIEMLAGRGDFDGALRKATIDIEENGESLQVAVEWADVVISMTMFDPDSVPPETLEPAMRLFLTSLLEKVPRPIGIDSTATGFEKISNLFFALGDKPSSLTAARFALNALQDPDQSYAGEGYWREIAIERVEKRIRLLD